MKELVILMVKKGGVSKEWRLTGEMEIQKREESLLGWCMQRRLQCKVVSSSFYYN
jgi:hypothetical protein